MSHLQQSPSVGKSPDLATQFTIICHLMTCYAVRPCEPIAANINRHMEALLISPAADSLGDWHGTIQQLSQQWNAITARHVKHHQKTTMAEKNSAVEH